MITPQCKRFLLGLASCVFGLILFFPTSSWAVSFTFDLTTYGFNSGSVLNFDGEIGNLTFSSDQSISRTDLSALFDFTTTNAAGTLWETATVQKTNPELDCKGWTSCSYDQKWAFELIPGQNQGEQAIQLTRLIDDYQQFGTCGNPCGSTGSSGAYGPVVLGPDNLNQVPEPATIALFASGLLGLAGYRWHQRRRERQQVS